MESPTARTPEPTEWKDNKRPIAPFTVKLMVSLFLFIAVSTGPRYLPPAWGAWLTGQTRQWLTRTANPPSWLSSLHSHWPAWMLADWSMRGGPSAAGGAWPWILSSPSRVTAAFGWQNPGPNAHFQGGISIQTASGQPVFSGPGGTVAQVQTSAQGITVKERISSQLTVVVEGLAKASVHAGSRVARGQSVGTTGSKPIRLEVLDRGYPVNPLNAKFFGHPSNLRL